VRVRPETIALSVLAALTAAYAASGLYAVRSDERAVVTRFGTVVGEAPPGVHYHAPWPFGAAVTPRVAVREAAGAAEPERRALELLTGDRCLVECVVGLECEVPQAAAAIAAAGDVHALSRAAAEAAVAEAVARSTFAEVVGAGLARIETEATAATQAALDRAGVGVRVISVTLASVALPGDAGRAAARADSIGTLADAAVSAARDHRSRLSQLARGESASLLAAARSHGERVAREAERESARFAMLLAEYRNAPAETRERLRRETLEEVLGSVRCLGAREAAVAAGDTAGMASEHQP